MTNLKIYEHCKRLIALSVLVTMLFVPVIVQAVPPPGVPMSPVLGNQTHPDSLHPAPHITLRVDGHNVNLEQWPGSELMLNHLTNSTYVPVRALIESVGGRVEFNQGRFGAVINMYFNDDNLRLTTQDAYGRIALTTVEFNDVIIDEGSAVKVNDRILVPLRMVLETFELQVEWNTETNTIDVFSI